MTAPGALIAGRYRLVRQIGGGGMGSVWEAWDEFLQRRVAAKQLLPQPGLGAEEAATARNRVIREARITARLHHPNAVTLYDVVGYDGRPCLIMQFVPSVTLSTLVRTEGPVQPQFAARIGTELASALGAAHDVGIIHRDVKPGNVLIADDSSAKLTDFGISHAVGDATLTSTGMISGTPAFLAPEVARGAASSFAADVFSLGATLYAAMEGGPPFGTDPNPMAVLHRVASGHLIPPTRCGRLTPLILQMLAQDPADRPTTAAITDELVRIDQEFTGARPTSPSSALAAAATEALQVVRPTPSAELTMAEPRTAMEVPPAVPVRRTPTDTQPEPARRRRIGVLPVTVIAAVVIAVAVVGVLLASNRSSDDQAGPPAQTSTASTSGGPNTTPGSSSPGSPAVRSSSTPRTGRTALPPPATASRATTSRSTTASAIVPPSSTAATTSTRSASSSSSTAPSSTARSSTAPSSTAPSSTAPSSAPGTPTTTELARAVTDYYALLPANTDAAWERLTPRFQSTTAVDRQYYQRFWNSIRRVTIRAAEGSPPDTAGAEITYYFKDGRVAVEATLFTLERDGEQLDIDTSTVLTSEVN